MQTTLPDLPFPYKGISINATNPLSDEHASRRHPRTNDLASLEPWSTFEQDIHQVIIGAMARKNLQPGTSFLAGASFVSPTSVTTEEELCFHAHAELHGAVLTVMQTLGIDNGYFRPPGSGNSAVIGAPDCSWVRGNGIQHPKLVVEYTPEWVADLKDIPGFFQEREDARDGNSKQSIEALEQLYGYMAFNNNKYGILTNWTRVWFLRRIESDSHQKLEYYGLGVEGGAGLPSMLKAWVGMVLLAEKDYFYAPPPSIGGFPRGPSFDDSVTAKQNMRMAITAAKNYEATPDDGTYSLLPLDRRLCSFELSYTRAGGKGSIVRTTLQQGGTRGKDSICKLVDATRYPEASRQLEKEAYMYAKLFQLQGRVIPKVYGHYDVWGILDVLALEPVGKSITADRVVDQGLRTKMEGALQAIHDAGYLHGDVARRNFCERGNDVFIVDLEHAQLARTSEEKESEMKEIRLL